MDEDEVSCMRGEKLSSAVQSIKDNLTCRICLELFFEPVTIKCGHKFCRACILRVTNNENSSCPFCNTKIQKRSIPKNGNPILQATLNFFENLVEAIKIDSGIDALQSYNKVKNTKESLLEYSKPSTSKVQDTPSTSHGSLVMNQKLTKSKNASTSRRLSLTKKKSDNRSPSQSTEKNTLHKYLSNKADPVPDQVVQSQEKVKFWLESCASDDNSSKIGNLIQASSSKFKDDFSSDPIAIPPDQIFGSPQNNEIQKSDVSPAPSSETSSGSKYKEIQMKIQEAEIMAKKKKISLDQNEKNNVKTPSSVPALSHLHADDWRRVKQVGRGMQVKTYKTLNVSIEKYSPPVVDDTVVYNSTNNDSNNISHDYETKNISTEKTPLQTKENHPLKSDNNNLSKKSPRITIEDYKRRSLDLTDSPKEDFSAAFKVDDNQINEIIGLTAAVSVPETIEKTKTTLSSVSRLKVKSKLDLSSPSKCKINSGLEFLEEDSSNWDNRTVINDQNSPLKKRRLSLKNLKDPTTSKNSSLPSISDKTKEKKKESLNRFSTEKLENKLLQGSCEKTNSVTQTLKSTKSAKFDNPAINRSSSSSIGCRFVFKKLGKICKKKDNVPFRYLGKLQREKCIIFDGVTPANKSALVLKSIIPVNIDFKHLIEDRSIVNLEEFSSHESHLKLVTPKSNLQLKLPIKRSSSVNNYDKAMNVDKDIDFDHRPGSSKYPKEIDETIPSAKIVVKNNSDFEKVNLESEIDVEKVEDYASKSSRERAKSLKNKNFEKVRTSINENVSEPFRHFDEDNKSTNSTVEIETFEPIIESSSRTNPVDKSTKSVQKLSSGKKCLEKVDMDKVLEDMISIGSDDSEAQVHETNSMQKVNKASYSKSSWKSERKIIIKSDVESCTESEVSVTSVTKIEDAKSRYSSASSSTLKTTKKKKRTHSESSNDDDDDVGSIINKWVKNDKDQVSKKPKIILDSEEMINRNASKVRNRSRYSLSSSSDDQEETVKENKHLQNSFNDEVVPTLKSQSTEVNVNKLITIPSSLQSADLFESNEQSVQLKVPSLKKQFSETTFQVSVAMDSDMQSDKENISEGSHENITVINTRQLKRRKSVASKTANNDDKENNEYNRTEDYKKSIKTTEEHVDEIESSQKRKKFIVSKDTGDHDKRGIEYKRTANYSASIKATEEPADEIENSLKDQDKTVDNFENESNPYFVRDSLLNVTQEQLACKDIEKNLFGVDLSKINENQNENPPLDINKISTPHKKLKESEENDDFDSDNISATPVVKRRHIIHFLPSQMSPRSEIVVSQMSSPGKNISLIPAITPMKNTKSYPLCHSTPMISTDGSENRMHSQVENVKIICTSLTPENLKLVQKFADKFNVQLQANFDIDVTHVVVKVDPQTKVGPKTFKYIQGIAFKKYVVSFEWITDCLAENKLLNADNEKYDVLDSDLLESACKKSRLSSQKIFKNFVFYCLEPFDKVSWGEFIELLIYNGAEIVRSFEQFRLHKGKIKIIIVGSDDVTVDGLAILKRAEAVAVHFEWIVDSLSQFQILSLPSYFCETTIDKARRLELPPELLVEEETLEGDENEDEN